MNVKLKRKLTEEEYESAKNSQEEGSNSIELSKEFDLSLVEVNKVMSSNNYAEYNGTFDDNKTTQSSFVEAGEVVKPFDKGFLRGVLTESTSVEKMASTNGAMSSQLLVLREQIKVSWDMVSLLEKRKEHLNKEIQNMESYIRSGIEVAERHLED